MEKCKGALAKTRDRQISEMEQHQITREANDCFSPNPRRLRPRNTWKLPVGGKNFLLLELNSRLIALKSQLLNLSMSECLTSSVVVDYLLKSGEKAFCLQKK